MTFTVTKKEFVTWIIGFYSGESSKLFNSLKCTFYIYFLSCYTRNVKWYHIYGLGSSYKEVCLEILLSLWRMQKIRKLDNNNKQRNDYFLVNDEQIVINASECTVKGVYIWSETRQGFVHSDNQKFTELQRTSS